jgi:hypothetical protein
MISFFAAILKSKIFQTFSGAFSKKGDDNLNIFLPFVIASTHKDGGKLLNLI